MRPVLTSLALLAALAIAPAAAEPATNSPAAEPAIAAPRPFDPRAVYRRMAREEAERHGVPAELVDAVMRTESNYNPLARGAAGEVGLMQVMPPTARLLGFSGSDLELADAATNIRLGTRYLAQAWRLGQGDICTAVMKYRAGHNETRFSVLSVQYCQKVRQHLAGLGYPVTGSVPEPTFGFRADTTRMGVAIGTQAAARRLASGRKLKPRVRWAEHDSRMRALNAQARGFTGL
jgi:soluble lytic murein transglycosylase-like protein